MPYSTPISTFWKSLCLLVLYCTIYNSTTAQNEADARMSIELVDSLNAKAFSLKQSNVVAAYAMLLNAESQAIKLNYQKGLVTNYLHQGGIFFQSGMPKKALDKYYQSYNLANRLNEKLLQAKASQMIAQSLLDTKAITEAIKLLEQNVTIYKSANNIQELVNTYNTLATVYQEKNDAAKVALFINEAYHLAVNAKYKYGLKKCLYNKAILYQSQGKYNLAEQLLDSALQLNNSNDNYGKALILLQKAKVATDAKQNSGAIVVAESALAAATNGRAVQLQMSSLHLLINAYQQNGNTTKLIALQNKLIQLQDSTFEEQNNYVTKFADIIREQEDRYQQSKQQIASAEALADWQQTGLAVLIAGLVVVIVLAGQAYNNFKKAQLAAIELERKNEIIQTNATHLDTLNQEIRAQNEKLEAENQLKDKLLSIISHDLRHPLVNTKSVLDLINLKLVSAQETEQLLEQLEGQYVHSITLLDNLLFWIRSQMEGVKLPHVPNNMFLLVRQLIDEQKIALSSKHIQLINQVDSSLVLMAEKEMLRIIFRNLISNAIKFTPEDGIIIIRSSKNDTHAIIEVEDSGIGMSADTIHKVNARSYFTTKGTRNEKGSGFGLALVTDLITRHGGKLDIKSVPGVG
ncbi:MAG TPA: hypothetical protein DCL43_11125, partial [Chitinophagaceae bacterium]|nr:hypothetical protein [Chitinophagaceae bacterium]